MDERALIGHALCARLLFLEDLIFVSGRTCVSVVAPPRGVPGIARINR